MSSKPSVTRALRRTQGPISNQILRLQTQPSEISTPFLLNLIRQLARLTSIILGNIFSEAERASRYAEHTLRSPKRTFFALSTSSEALSTPFFPLSAPQIALSTPYGTLRASPITLRTPYGTPSIQSP